MQIALPKSVYLLRTFLLTKLPEALKVILANPRVIKIGRNIGSDLAKLARDFPDFHLPSKINGMFEGTIELGLLAKVKNIVPKATASLAHITAAALHSHLSKDCRATEWSVPQLSADQTQYAALDAWVGLEIWNTIKDNQTQGRPLETASPVGQLVSLFVRKQEVARGSIVHQPAKYPIVVNEETGETVMLNVSATRTRALVAITEVLAPQVQLTLHKKTLHQLQAGRETFEVVVSLSCLRTRGSETPVPLSVDPLPLAQPDEDVTVILPPDTSSSEWIASQETDQGASDDDGGDSNECNSNNEEDNTATENLEYTQLSELQGDLFSRILADVFHEMDKVERTISKKHSLCKHFAVAFSDTMLVPDKGDRKKVQDYLQKAGLKWDSVCKSHPDWLWKRVRRYIPGKDFLFCILEEFFNAWGPVICSFTGYPLFSEESWKKAKGVLHDVKMGWISDPQGIPLYTLLGHDQHGLALYHCIRGTNSVEGGVHNPIRRNFASLNASVELADCLIADFRHRHNVDVGTFHKTGARYHGHYDPWLDHEISQLRGDISWFHQPSVGNAIQDTDPLQFAQTDEQFGIASIAPMLRIQNDFAAPEVITPAQLETPGLIPMLSHVYPMGLHLSHLKGKRKDVYSYLALAQQTRFAVTPIHTQAEFKLFNSEVAAGGLWFVAHGQPDFDSMAKWWSSKANGTTIFYKLREHLSIYHKTWTVQQHGICSLRGSEKQRQRNTSRIRSNTHSATVLAAALRQNPGVQATARSVLASESLESMEVEDCIPSVGQMEVERFIPDIEHMEVEGYNPNVSEMEDIQGTASTTQGTPQFQHTLAVGQPALAFFNDQLASRQESHFIPWSTNELQRKKRTCVTCGRSNCPGRGNRSLCKDFHSINVSSLIYCACLCPNTSLLIIASVATAVQYLCKKYPMYSLHERVSVNREMHGFWQPVRVVGMGRRGYGYGSQFPYP